MPYVLNLQDIDHTDAVTVGGKAANLGRLYRVPGVRVPAGFCVTTEAFDRMVAAGGPTLEGLLARLFRLDLADRDAVVALSAEVRRAIEAIAIPSDVESALTQSLALLGDWAAPPRGRHHTWPPQRVRR